MTDWVDDFTHDYVADGTYTLIIGADGSTFTIGGGQLASSSVLFVDERTSLGAGEVTVDIADIAALSFLDFGFTDPTFSQSVFGVVEPGGRAGRTMLVEWIYGSHSDFRGGDAPTSGGFEAVLSWSASDASITVGSTTVDLPISPTDAAGLGAALFPYLFLTGSPAVATRWKHTTGGAPPLVPGVKAGAQQSGPVPLHPLI